MSCNARVLMYQRNLQLQYLYNFELNTLSNIYNCKQVDILISKTRPCKCYTIVLEKFDVKKFRRWCDTTKIELMKYFLTMNKKVTFLFIRDSKGRKYFNTNKFHTKIFNGEFFPNYGTLNIMYIKLP